MIDPASPGYPFQLSDQSGRLHTLADYRGRPLVLYFYPKDDTPGCTDQACQFRDMFHEFERIGVAILGVSPDDAKSHARFAEKFDLPFPLLIDAATDGQSPPVCDAYGVWQEKSMYGKRFMGVVRTTYLIGSDGYVIRRWDRVKVSGHGREVLEAAQQITAGT